MVHQLHFIRRDLGHVPHLAVRERRTEDCELRADHLAQVAVDALTSFKHYGVVVTLFVKVAAHVEYALRAVLDAKLATFAALLDNVDFTVRDFNHVVI
jgi:hypothetical protein